MDSQIEILIKQREDALNNAKRYENESREYHSFMKYANNLLEKINNFDENDEQTKLYLDENISLSYDNTLSNINNLLEKINNCDKNKKQTRSYINKGKIYKNISLSYTDTYSSNYKYGKLYSKNQCIGEKIYNNLNREDWEEVNSHDNISEKNDNRMDRYYGFTSTYKHKYSDIFVDIICRVSNTGKTKEYIFSSYNFENKENFKKKLNNEL